MTRQQLHRFAFVGAIVATLALSFSAIIEGLILHAIGVSSLGIVAAVSQLIILEYEAQKSQERQQLFELIKASRKSSAV
jgi:hypothetical protein